MFKIIIISKDENSKNIIDALNIFSDKQIYLISPNAFKSKFNATNLIKINDNDILNFDILKEQLNINRFGWYYQQFLKYSAILQIEGKDFLILDGDTVIDKKIVKENLLCTTGRSTIENYNDFYRIIFPDDDLVYKSFITNQMVFNKLYLKEMLKNIEFKYEKNWIDVIANLIKTNPHTMFSEYQTYAEYVLNRYKDINIMTISIFRRMDLINDSVENALNKYNVISYENYHKKDILRKIRAKIYYFFGKDIG